MRKLLSLCAVGTLLILPALCSALECSLRLEPAVSPHDCCPRGGQPVSHKNQHPQSNAAACPYFFLDKIKKAAVYVAAAPLPQWAPRPALTSLALSPAPRRADRSRTYLLNRVLLL